MTRTARRPHPGNPLLAVAYVRVSTDEQRLGPEAQRAAIEAWAAREGVAVVAWHTDSGISGGSDLDNRPALALALAGIRVHRAGLLLVARRDRLARDVVVAATIERATEALGAKVMSADGAPNGTGAAEQFMRTMLDAAAAYERALIRERTKAALAAKKARGERVGTIPYGYSVIDGKLVPNEAEQGVLRVVRELRAAGLSLRAIETELAARGILSRTGRKPIALPQIAKMVKAA